MLAELGRLKPQIVACLESQLTKVRQENSHINHWVDDVMARIHDFSIRGKMIRGGLVDIGLRAFSQTTGPATAQFSSAAIAIGAAMELLQSLLLIHDDIMDQDDKRRGKPSLHAQYRQLAQQAAAVDSNHTGESMAICAGDACAFLALDTIAGLDLPPGIYRALMQLLSRELAVVVFAQMGDVWNGAVDHEVGFDEILKLYRFKTGRYTFSLPLMAGALLAEASRSSVAAISELGEVLGILFQIKDDDMGLFAGSQTTGKPMGSDIRENKKTLHRHFLLERADISTRQHFLTIFGNKNASSAEIAEIQATMEELGVRSSIDAELGFYAAQAREKIDSLPGLNAWGAGMLNSLLEWNLTRLA